MYRVTTLENGVLTKDRDEFSDRETALNAARAYADSEYVEALTEWFDRGTTSPLVIKESSVYSDLWEYIP